MEPPPSLPSAFASADDTELLQQIYGPETNTGEAELAFRTFFQRHAEFLRCACLKYGFHHPTIPAEAVANHVLAKVYNRQVDDFQLELGMTDADVVARKVRAWLIKLARFTFFDLRKPSHRLEKVADFEPLDWDVKDMSVTPKAYVDDDAPLPNHPERATVLALHDSLSEDDRFLLCRSLDYYDRFSGDCKVPAQIAQDIARELGVTTAAARQRRKRLFDRIREALANIQQPQT